MGSYMCVMQLWRKKQSHLVGVLPKISRAFQTQKTISDQLLGMVKSGVARQSTAHSSLLTRGIVGADAISVLSGRKFTRELINATWTPLQLRRNYGANNVIVPRFSRTMSRPPRNRSETKSDIITVEDPIDAVTYNVPQEPLTFVAGASYSVAILVGLGIAIACYYAVYEGLILKPNAYQIFKMALKRIQDDAKVRKKVGPAYYGCELFQEAFQKEDYFMSE